MELTEAMEKMPDGKLYECEYYKVWAKKTSCFFCKHCTDIWFDYTNGPYMFHCEAAPVEDGVRQDWKMTDKGLKGECGKFEDAEGEDGNNNN